MSQKNVNILSPEMSKKRLIFYDVFRRARLTALCSPDGARSCSCAINLNLLETAFLASARDHPLVERLSAGLGREPRDVEALVGSGTYPPGTPTSNP
jgi:hypothetical protein